MINGLLKKVFGSKNERDIKRMNPIVDKVNSFEEAMKQVSDDGFKAVTEGFRERLAGDKVTVDDLLPEAFAAVREASERVLKMRHFDAQILGGLVLHQGKIAEMKTGEGKTLAATLALYLNALTGKGAHLVTVNDYLSRRDAVWMGPLYEKLGLSVGVIQHEVSFIYDTSFTDESSGHYHLRQVERREAYRADITYGTNNEFGFDYLRDNMKFSIEEYVQRELHYAIVDEVDSILIDEARTPLIISGATEDTTEKYYSIDGIIPALKKEDHFTVDEKARQVLLTDAGVEKVESLLDIANLYDIENIETLHHVNQALKAHVLFQKDVDYVVNDGAVIIVDEFTGRLMEGRRWSDGLHQAVEAKEGVKIESENQTLATVTFQNYFRMYEKLAGMTGTADTEAAEFNSIYKLEVVVVPTNKPMIRKDNRDLVYKTRHEKFNAVIEEIKGLIEKGRPVLVGTISIDDSERLSGMLMDQGVRHDVLNAKHHEREAEIIAQAGRLGAVTLSTNMAGRGTDIVLGGNPEHMAMSVAGKDESTPAYKEAYEKFSKQCAEEKAKVLELGGLHILGTERHESRRIDNQLRGRAGRQGDPGSSRFYLSFEDDLLRIFGSDRIASIMGKIGLEEDVPIEHGLVSRAIESAQKKVEAHNFDIRKHLLEYDDVMNQQREVVYGYRKQILAKEGLRDMVKEFALEMADEVVATRIEEKGSPEEWDIKGLNEGLRGQFEVELAEETARAVDNRDALTDLIIETVWPLYEAKVELAGEENFSEFERIITLTTLDNLWKDHLLSMDHLKGGIGLRGYGQQDPLNEYKKEGYDLFVGMIFNFKSEIVERLFKVQISIEEGEEEAVAPPPPLQPSAPAEVTYSRGDEEEPDDTAEEEKAMPVVREGEKIGRNDPCSCGSGKKYKKCCGAA